MRVAIFKKGFDGLLAGFLGVVVVLGILQSRKGARAAVLTPSEPGFVLGHVPSREREPAFSELSALRREIQNHPEDVAARTRAAELSVAEYRRRSDPRLIGQAEAFLAPYWNQPEPAGPVLLLRATIRQSLHQFQPALLDLDALLAREPDNGQARWTRAVVLTVTGRAEEAAAECIRLRPDVPRLVFAACDANAKSLMGRAAEALTQLSAALERSRRDAPELRSYAYSVLGEIAERTGAREDAERAYQAALAIDPDDPYSLSVFSDALIASGRSDRVLSLLGGREAVDALLLRLAIAAQSTGSSKAESYATDLRSRFADAHRRGDAVHLREEARFELTVEQHPERALELALQNFSVQREPWDVRLVFEAALAAHLPRAAEPAVRFVDTTHLEHPMLRSLCARLAEALK